MQRSTRAVLAVAAGLWVAACGSDIERIGPEDTVAPTVTIVDPAAQALVPSRPRFLVRVTDPEDAVFPGTIGATIDGRNVSQTFLNGYDEDRGEILVPGTLELEDGAHSLRVEVSDASGNRGSAMVTFTVVAAGAPPGGGGT